jgi:hypothetical protein
MSNSAIDTLLNKTTAFERNFIYHKKMATLGGKNGKNGTGTQFTNGILTPGTTPEPDIARVEADKARQEAAVIAQAPQNPEAQAPQNQQDPKGENEDNSGDYRPSNGTKEEEEAIKRIMDAKKTQPRKILGVLRNYETPAQEKTEILKAYRNIGTLIHPEFCQNESADEAFDSKW